MGILCIPCAICYYCCAKKKSKVKTNESVISLDNFKKDVVTININSKDNNTSKIIQDSNNSKDKNYNNDNKILTNTLDIEKELISNFKYFNIFWYDPNKTKDFDYLKKYFKNVEVREESNLNSAYNFFKRETISEWIVVTPGSKGEELISKLQDFNCIKTFFIFCKDVKSHEKWANKIKKVGCVTSKAQILCQNFVEINKDYIIPDFNYQRKNNNNTFKIIEFINHNIGIILLSPKIIDMYNVKKIEKKNIINFV